MNLEGRVRGGRKMSCPGGRGARDGPDGVCGRARHRRTAAARSSLRSRVGGELHLLAPVRGGQRDRGAGADDRRGARAVRTPRESGRPLGTPRLVRSGRPPPRARAAFARTGRGERRRESRFGRKDPALPDQLPRQGVHLRRVRRRICGVRGRRSGERGPVRVVCRRPFLRSSRASAAAVRIRGSHGRERRGVRAVADAGLRYERGRDPARRGLPGGRRLRIRRERSVGEPARRRLRGRPERALRLRTRRVAGVR